MMLRDRKLIFLFCLSFIPKVYADLASTVDRTIISDLDLMTLTVRASDETADATIDFSSLSQDFKIITESSRQNSSMSIINGRKINVVYRDHVLTLSPKRKGNLFIPSFRAGNHRSEEIAILVEQQTEAQRQQMNQFVFFETLVDTNDTYVQGQIIYSVKLFYTDGIGGDFPQPPSPPDTVVETLETEKRYESIVDGQSYYVLEKSYALFPQRSGTLEIERERFIGTRGRGGAFSQRQRVNAISEGHTVVVKAIQGTPCEQKQTEDFFFETTVDSNDVYVQEQLIYTVKWFYVAGVPSDFPKPPILEDSLLETLGKEKRYESTVNKRSYNVLEKSYAIFPQHSGRLVIPRERFKGRASHWKQLVCVVSESHSILVKEIPETFSGKHWIPSHELKLKDTWSEHKALSVGEPAKREIEVLIEGFDGAIVPNLDNYLVENASLYKFPFVETKLVNSKGISTRTTIMIGVIPLKSGNLRFPEIRLHWWNTVTDKEEVAIISAKDFSAYSKPTLSPSPRHSRRTIER